MLSIAGSESLAGMMLLLRTWIQRLAISMLQLRYLFEYAHSVLRSFKLILIQFSRWPP